MIKLKEYENTQEIKDDIKDDKEKFIHIALNIYDFELEEILSFMEHYQNLKSISDNLIKLRKFIKIYENGN